MKPPIQASAAEDESESLSFVLAAVDQILMDGMLAYSNEVVGKVLTVRAMTAAAADATPDVDGVFDADTAARYFYDAYDLVQTGLVDFLDIPLDPPSIKRAVKFGVEAWRQAITDRLNDMIVNGSKPVKLGEDTIGPIRPGDLRGAITVGAGGSVSTAMGIPGGFSAGKIVTDALLANGIPIDGWLWHYAIGSSRRGFDGHKQLSGYVFDRPDDPELEILPQDAWLRRTHYAVGDHWGCACSLVPWIGPNWGPARSV